jgi:hypothetical protein
MPKSQQSIPASSDTVPEEREIAVLLLKSVRDCGTVPEEGENVELFLKWVGMWSCSLKRKVRNSS